MAFEAERVRRVPEARAHGFGYDAHRYAIAPRASRDGAAVRLPTVLPPRRARASRGARVLKRVMDILGAVFLLVVLAPVLLHIALLVKLAAGGPVLFRHPRVGRHGKTFVCYKFRTMIRNADEVLEGMLASDPNVREEWNRHYKLKYDPRVVPIGRILRRTSLDELPQLLNVLKGEMSLVGPRPIVSGELDRYRENVHHYLETAPGLTGLWQISGRNDLSYADRVSLDIWYSRNWSLWLDVVILSRTFRAIVSSRGAY
ncbi:UDP-phosphate galactose phosphotransferase [Sulfurifustis variabilis]|uniref:UDP-phosphate galactose phosphotransferase n=1 Tax=Sulfurifustis variabilis TaxID=1675686 RepID=A0A1B4VDJ9_9GAMM|nr:sugar transferase [Sulfurifustis variabilis]BAU48127.1 UDP-phosphate galactose phosphotransferase [Sulfurifustis variabilis]